MKKDHFAIIKIGGAQELIRLGDKLEVNRISTPKGKKHTIEEVLFLFDNGKIEIGIPYIKGCKVDLKVLDHKKGKKVQVIKFKAKSRYRRKKGHRQHISILEVVKIGKKTTASKKSKNPSKKAKNKKTKSKKSK